MAVRNTTGFHLTARQDQDLKDANALIDHRVKADFVLEDKAYDAHGRVRNKLTEKGLEVMISPKKIPLTPVFYEKNIYKSRHLMENSFAKLKQYRALAVRYDKMSKNFLEAIYVGAILFSFYSLCFCVKFNNC